MSPLFLPAGVVQVPDVPAGGVLVPCMLQRDDSHPQSGWLFVPHADGQWVSTAKPAPFARAVIEHWLGENAAAPAAAPPPAPTAAPAIVIPPLNDDLREILGRICFQCIRIAQALRLAGFEIAHSAEAEQAAVLHWLLTLYAEHGAAWRDGAEAWLRAKHDELQAKGGEA